MQGNKSAARDAEDRIDALEEALHRVRLWCDAYPEDIFTPLTKEETAAAVAAIRGAIGDAGSDRLHASWARHILTGLREYTNVLDQS